MYFVSNEAYERFILQQFKLYLFDGSLHFQNPEWDKKNEFRDSKLKYTTANSAENCVFICAEFITGFNTFDWL
jgi:hypothetical protein